MERNAKGLPKTVERYVQEHLDQGADEGAAWAIAWSRYCKYKKPGSPRCTREPGEYLTGKSARRIASRYLRAAGEGIPAEVVSGVNQELIRSGLDGNYLWGDPAEGIRETATVLGRFGLEMVRAPRLRGARGRADAVVVGDGVSGSLTLHWAIRADGTSGLVAYVG